MDYEAFESLSAEEQAKIFHDSPIKEKGELLLRSHEPDHLVHALSQEELFLVTKEMDLEERSEVLRYATLPQLFFISDIECWKKDRLDVQSFVQWLETLSKADDRQLFHWLFYGDYETIVSGFKKLIQVMKTEREYAMDETLGDTPFFTLDENYFIFVQEENLETVRRAFEILFENHRGRYTAVLEGLLAELEDEVEEEAYQMRLRRLAERGFPDPENARRIYRPISKEEYESFPVKNAQSPTVLAQRPSYVTLWNAKRPFLDEVLANLQTKNPAACEQAKEEITWLASKVFASEGIDFSSEERVRQGVQRAKDYISLGLELLSGQSLQKAVEIAEEKWLENVFRWAVSEILPMKNQALQLVKGYWGNSKEDFLKFLDPPYEWMARGLLQIIPQYHDLEGDDETTHLRDFSSIVDLKRVRTAIQQLASVSGLLAARFPQIFKKIVHWNESRDIPITLFRIINQGFVLSALKQPLEYRPVQQKEFAEFMKKQAMKGPARIFDDVLKQNFIDELFGTRAENLKGLWSLALGSFLDEVKDLKPERPVDPKYIRMIEISGA